MDYAEEQRTELETLGYIYPNELKILRETAPAVFRISVAIDDEAQLEQLRLHSQLHYGVPADEDDEEDDDEDDEDENDDDGEEDDGGAEEGRAVAVKDEAEFVDEEGEYYVQEGQEENPNERGRRLTRFRRPSFELELQYTAQYPETAPLFRFVRVRGIHSDDIARMRTAVAAAAQEQRGMAMVYTLVAGARETLDALLAERMAADDAARDERSRREIEAAQAHHAGTRVTPQAFAAWKAAFVAEARAAVLAAASASSYSSLSPSSVPLALQVAAAIDASAQARAAGKLTGRQLFEKDKTLASSDAQFMGDGDDAVDVDAALLERVNISERGPDDKDDDDDEDAVNQVLANFTEDD